MRGSATKKDTSFRRSLKVEEKKLPKKVSGQCENLGWTRLGGNIKIDPRDQNAQQYFVTFMHELVHRQFPFLDEQSVEDASVEMTHSLWEFGFRRTYQ